MGERRDDSSSTEADSDRFGLGAFYRNAVGEGTPIGRVLRAEDGALFLVREIVVWLALVAAIGVLLFAVSGVWPPMVAVESGSMQPHMHKGDLIFVTGPERFAPDDTVRDTGVVTYRAGETLDYRTFGSFGTVIVYERPNRAGPPVIHRARFWVEDGENWYERADSEYVDSTSCEELANCPAPHAGFITKGDNNPYYDQAEGIAPPVKPDWIRGTARLRLPYLGCVRLGLGENSCLR